jgi:hypothetical protein
MFVEYYYKAAANTFLYWKVIQKISGYVIPIIFLFDVFIVVVK